MKEIVDRLQENRQVELAKSILESKGYKVRKNLEEDYSLESKLEGYTKDGEYYRYDLKYPSEYGTIDIEITLSLESNRLSLNIWDNNGHNSWYSEYNDIDDAIEAAISAKDSLLSAKSRGEEFYEVPLSMFNIEY